MADFYGNLTDANAWHTSHNNTAWADADDTTKEAALLIASEWIDNRYGLQFSGYPVGLVAQTRQWPRKSAVDKYGYAIASDVIPAQVEQATYEVALRHIVKPGSLNVDWTPGQEKISVAVSGAVSVTYAGAYSYQDAQVQIGTVGAILAPILADNATGSMYSGRASRV